MNTSDLHMALREMRGIVGQPKMLVGLLGIAILATLAQPFGFRVPGHIGLTFIYWLLVIGFTFPLGNFISMVFALTWGDRRQFVAMVCAALTMGGVVTVLVYLMNTIFLDWPIVHIPRMVAIASSVFPTAALITTLTWLVFGPRRAESAPVPDRTPPLIARLPHQIRGAVLHLQAEDHYTRVATQNGTDLILLRFSDAVNEVAPMPGLRVHRSHWVASSAIVSVQRHGDGAQITLSNGTTVPASRSNLPQLRQAGLI
ncbi:MAG: LytTR family DNA-binding domain-containing protein [Planktomarina sp.]